MNNKVYIVQCKDYAEADDKIQALIDLMGGMGRFAKQGEKIVLKDKLLREARPEAAVFGSRARQRRPRVKKGNNTFSEKLGRSWVGNPESPACFRYHRTRLEGK